MAVHAATLHSELTLCLSKNLYNYFERPLTVYIAGSKKPAEFQCPCVLFTNLDICKGQMFTAVEGSFCELHCYYCHPEYKTLIEASKTVPRAAIDAYMKAYTFNVNPAHVRLVLTNALRVTLLTQHPLSICNETVTGRHTQIMPHPAAAASSPARSIVQYACNIYAWGIAVAIWACRKAIVDHLQNMKIRLFESKKILDMKLSQSKFDKALKEEKLLPSIVLPKHVNEAVFAFVQILRDQNTCNILNSLPSDLFNLSIPSHETDDSTETTLATVSDCVDTAFRHIKGKQSETIEDMDIYQLTHIQSIAPPTYKLHTADIVATNVQDVVLLSYFTLVRLKLSFILGLLHGFKRLKTISQNQVAILIRTLKSIGASQTGRVNDTLLDTDFTPDEHAAMRYALELKAENVNEVFYEPFIQCFLTPKK